MLTIKCDKCGDSLALDEQSTVKSYLSDDVIYKIDKTTGELVDKAVQQYLVYTCRKCKAKHRFTYKEWEERYRKEVLEEVLSIRKMYAFKHLNPSTIKADNGLEFCGQCRGYADDGYCLVDIIKQCVIRKKLDGV